MAEDARPYGYVDEADYQALKERNERGVAAFVAGETDAREGREADAPEGYDEYERRMYRLGFFGPAKPAGGSAGEEFEELPY